MSQRLEGLWLGGSISREAAEEVERLVWARTQGMLRTKVAVELLDLANAIRAQIQKLPPPPKPMCDLV